MPEMRKIPYRKAHKYVRRHVYYQHTRTGEYLLVAGLRKVGPNIEVTLVSGRRFHVGPWTEFYTCTHSHEDPVARSSTSGSETI